MRALCDFIPLKQIKAALTHAAQPAERTLSWIRISARTREGKGPGWSLERRGPLPNLLGWAKEGTPVHAGVPGAHFAAAPRKGGTVSSLEESLPPPHKGKETENAPLGRLRARRAAQAEIKPEALHLAVAGITGRRFSSSSHFNMLVGLGRLN